MAQASSKLFDNVGRMMNDAAGVADGVRREVESMVRAQAERFVMDMNLVKREDYDALRELVQTQSAELRALKAEVAALKAGGRHAAQAVKVAVISDVHGNRLALEAVLDDIVRQGVDATFNLGDLVSGPLEPNWVADILMDLDIPTVRGNHERASDRQAAGEARPRRPLRAGADGERGTASGSRRCRRRWRCSTTCSSATARRPRTTIPGSIAGGTAGR